MPDIADLIAQYIGPQDVLGVTDATLTKMTNGAPAAGDLTGSWGTAPVSYGARGMIETAMQFSDGTLVRENHVLISLIGGTIQGGAVSEPGNTIFIASKLYPNGHTYTITRIQGDGVGAMYECEATR